MTLSELLAQSNVRTALIVDDVYDPVPTAADIGPDNDEWPIFNDDLTESQRARIAEYFPNLANTPFNECIADNSYVATLWQLREELGDVVAPLFRDYLSDHANDQEFVRLAREQLEGLGLYVSTAGRIFDVSKAGADLILIDLFLGKTQGQAAIGESKEWLRNVLKSRSEAPPLVILMSRSPRLHEKREEFRDEVGLLDSAFRILKKDELKKGDLLKLQLERLTINSADSRKLALFFQELESGLARAADRTLQLLRKLRLSDIGQIQELLLNVEGQPVGSYLVDVFDRVLQHEIERENGIIDAARELNSFSEAKYPPPYVSGSPDLQELVQRIVTQNDNRRRLLGTLLGNVTFGDVLRMPDNAGAAQQQPHPFSDLTTDNVLLVLTPACDFQRSNPPRILLLVGKIMPLTASGWGYKDVQTPATRIDGILCWIKWDLKHIDSISSVQLEQALNSGAIRTVARLRESHALELQQRVLSDLGRVGQLVVLPVTIQVNLDVCYVDKDLYLRPLDVDELAAGAVCFVGRKKDSGKALRLVLTEVCCDRIYEALTKVDKNLVLKAARNTFEQLASTTDITIFMSQGIDITKIKPDEWLDVTPRDGAGGKGAKIGLIGWNMASPGDRCDTNRANSAGIVFLIRDVERDQAPGLRDTICEGLIEQSEALQEGAESGQSIPPAEEPVAASRISQEPSTESA